MLSDAPELVALANLAGVAPSKVAAGFNDPEQFFEHLTLDELVRLQGACERLQALQQEMIDAMEAYTEAAKRALPALAP